MFINYGWKKPKASDAKKKKEKRAVPRFYRVPATVRREKTGFVIPGRIILSDVTLTGVGIFLPEPIARGESVSLVIALPQSVYVKGTVEWCTYYSPNTRVLSVDSLAYRALVKFDFESPQEREAFRKFML